MGDFFKLIILNLSFSESFFKEVLLSADGMNQARRVILSKIVKILGHSMMEDWLVSPKGKNFQIKELKH